MDIPQEINKVLNTLQQVQITATYGNMDKLIGCMQALARIADEAEKKKTEEA